MDQLYERRRKLVCSADAAPGDLFKENEVLSSSCFSAADNRSDVVIHGANQPCSPTMKPIAKKVVGGLPAKRGKLYSASGSSLLEIGVSVGELAAVKDLGFAFRRAASRLVEVIFFVFVYIFVNKTFSDE